uniref:Uncharacterized protein n=1 Tax=Pundamilia nyererei TaxID=303518 RepID=A0A3B4H3J1_9CICH
MSSQLLVSVAHVKQALCNCFSRRHRLVQQQRHGFCLLRLGHQHCVAAQHYGLVLHLPRVRDAVGYPVQQVQVSRSPGLVIHMHHADALGADGQPHLSAVLAHLAFAPDLAHRYVRAAVSFGLDCGSVPQVKHRVSGIFAGDLQLFPL